MTFDAGQTLVELDLDFLARRLGERGLQVGAAALEAASEAAWQRYDALVDQHSATLRVAARPTGGGACDAAHGHPWHALMATLLERAGLAEEVGPVVDWLWIEQRRANLWRRPIPAMVALARELAARGVAVAVLSNSEGTLAELLAEIGVADPFLAVIDSGRLGIEKPDRRIFDHALELAGATTGVHIGDSWSADIAGALDAGWRAVWYGRRVAPVDDARVAIARDAGDVRTALVRFGV